MKSLHTILGGFLMLLAAVFALTVSPAMADEPVTKWQWGCEWQQASNGNYWFKVNGGCPHWIGLGYASAHDFYGKEKPEIGKDDEDDADEPEEPGPEPAKPAA